MQYDVEVVVVCDPIPFGEKLGFTFDVVVESVVISPICTFVRLMTYCSGIVLKNPRALLMEESLNEFS